MKKLILVVCMVAGLSSCSQNDDDNFDENPMISEVVPLGTNYSISQTNLETAFNNLKQSLGANEAISIVAEVDHTANAESIGEKLEYTRVIFFGNPALGTPLMQKNQLSGLDLPQKILFYKNEENDELVLYNATNYLSSRHSLEGVGTLDKISGALEDLVSNATKNEVEAAGEQNVDPEEGIITVASSQDFNETYASLKKILQDNAGINIMAELDHQANAATVGLELRPTKIIIFGNPVLGTPLMQENQSTGLDLPQKMLVWEDENGQVSISYNDPDFIAQRHRLENSTDELDKIAEALNNISTAASTSE